MARAKANDGRSGTLADEAWAAGCRDVQAAINWASARGEIPGRSFQAAFRRVLAAQDTGPPPPAGRDTGVTAGLGKHIRPSGPAGVDSVRPAAVGSGEPAARSTPARAGRTEDRPAPSREAGPAVEALAVTPAEFVEDMRQLRRLVAKYGKKGLADLIGMLAG
jgi:hypothetical protein